MPKKERFIQLDHLYSVTELSELFGCTPETIRSYYNKKLIKGGKIGNTMWFLGSNVMRFLTEYKDTKHTRKLSNCG